MYRTFIGINFKDRRVQELRGGAGEVGMDSFSYVYEHHVCKCAKVVNNLAGTLKRTID